MQCLAYINVPLSTYCKIRYVRRPYRNLQRHRAFLPAKARLSFLELLDSKLWVDPSTDELLTVLIYNTVLQLELTLSIVSCHRESMQR